MAKPQFLQELTHGKLITQQTFPKFVETYNYTVNRCNNLKGDFDVNPKEGQITIDEADPEHPVIRLRKTKGTASSYPGCFEISEDKTQFLNQYYIEGAKIMDAYDTTPPTDFAGQFVALVVPAIITQGTKEDPYLNGFASIEDMQSAADAQSVVVIPLYQLDENTEVVCDFRFIPRAQMIEFFS